MTTKERLHKLVDQLSDREADEALRLLTPEHGDGLTDWLESRPAEDEEISKEEEAAVAAAREEIAAGAPLISLDEIKREFDYSSE